MTFIDVTQGRPSTDLIVGFSFLCVVSVCAAIAAVNLGRSRLHYQSFFSVRVLFPFALFILALENAAYAASGVIYDAWILGKGGESHNNIDDNPYIKAILVLQTVEVPILLVVTFEITYLVHKRRSVNFCGMYFDEGVRVNNTALMSFMLRNSIRLLATALLVTGLAVNFDVFAREFPVEDGELAGVAGWYNVVHDDEGYSVVRLLLSLLPTAVLTLVSFYLSVMLWRYGTESSMVVHSSICNPWFYPFFGTLAMVIGQLFADNLYTIMSNAGMLIFVITILIVMKEVDKDMIANNDVACFLVQVAQKGDEIRVCPPSQPEEKIQEKRTCTNAVHGTPKHDGENCRINLSIDEKHDQKDESNQCKTHEKTEDDTIEEGSSKLTPNKFSDV